MKKVILVLLTLVFVAALFADAKFNDVEQTKYASASTSNSTRATVLSEDFSSGALPTGWQNVANSGTEVWYFDNPDGRTINTPTASNGFAIFDSDYNGSGGGAEDSDLISPVIDCTGMANVTLEFYHYFYAGYGGAAEVLYSVDNGANWTQLEAWSASSTANAEFEQYDISTAAAGQSQVLIKWHWTGDWSWYWAVDDVRVFERMPYDVAITRLTSDQNIAINGYYYYYCEIRNNGANNDTFDLALVDQSASTWYTIKDKNDTAVITTIAINATSKDTVIVRVDVPSAASDGDTDTVKLKATSQGDNTVSATLPDNIITTAKGVSNLPFTDHFDARNFSDWMNTSNQYTSVDWNASAAQAGAGGVRFADTPSDGYYGAASISKYMQGFNAASITNPVLDFWYKFSGSNANSNFYVQFLTANGTTAGVYVSESDSNTDWTHIQIDITTLSNYADLQASTWLLNFYVQPYADLTCDLDEVQIYDLSAPAVSTNPSPADAAVNVASDATLSWESVAALVDSVVVWFGDNTRAMAAVDTLVGDPTTYDQGAMTLGTTYNWKIVRYNAAGDNSATAPTWSFTVISDPLFTLDPDETTHDFGSVLMGNDTAWQTYLVTNAGGDGLVINDIVLSDATDFTLLTYNTFPDTLNNGDTLSVKVKFAPATAGSKSANLIFKKNALTNHRIVALSGTSIDPTINTFPDTTDFEPNIPLGWEQSTTDDIDWTLRTGGTPSSDTGPTADHTIGDATGHYLYTEASGNNGTHAILTTPTIDFSSMTNAPRMKFWYNMYGADMGTLNVDAWNGSTWTNVWTLSGDQGQGWNEATVNLVASYTKVRFDGLTGSSYTSDIAIDDIVFEEGPAGAPAPATTPSPADAATGVENDVNLTWVSGGGAGETGYKISLWYDDADKANHYICQDKDLGLVTSYDPSADGVDNLAYLETYYWEVVAYNASGDATGSSTWSFTVTADPTINTFPYTNSFESAFPQAGWAVVDVNGTAGNWTQETASVHPTGISPEDGTYMLRWNSWTANSSNNTRIETADCDFTSLSAPIIKFWMYHDTGYTSNTDGVQIQVYTGGSWVNVGTPINRYDGTAQWTQHEVDLSAYAGSIVKLGFYGISDYGNDVYIDNMWLGDGILPVPANVAIAISGNDVNLTWDAVTGANSYVVLRASDPFGTFTTLGTAATNSYTDTGAASGGTKYFYQVKASSAAPAAAINQHHRYNRR